jgi:hypothetical protein
VSNHESNRVNMEGQVYLIREQSGQNRAAIISDHLRNLYKKPRQLCQHWNFSVKEAVVLNRENTNVSELKKLGTYDFNQ